MDTVESLKDRRRMYLSAAREKLCLLARAALNVTLDPIRDVRLIAGPRAGALLIDAGVAGGALMNYLRADECANARQIVRWEFTGDPTVGMDGVYVRLEANWPADLADTAIELRAVSRHPLGYGRWIAAQNENGVTINGIFDDQTPHWLIGGTSGSGKTTAILSLVYQLSRRVSPKTRREREQKERDHEAEMAKKHGRAPREIVPENPDTRLVLIDGRNGAGLAVLQRLPHLVGPLATDIDSATLALAWVDAEIDRRNRLIVAQGAAAVRALPRIVVVIDEFQELFQDPTVRELARKGLATGRAVRVSFVLATQSPAMAAFGDDTSMRRNLSGRIALRVTDGDASRVVMGNSDFHAERLAGQGDCYILTPERTQRAQICYLDPEDIAEEPQYEPELAEWPEPAQTLPGQSQMTNYAFSGTELAHALHAVTQGWGRNRLGDTMVAAGLGRPGGARGPRLLKVGRELQDTLETLGLIVVVAPTTDSDLEAADPEQEAVDSAPETARTEPVPAFSPTDGEWAEIDPDRVTPTPRRGRASGKRRGNGNGGQP